MQQLHLVGFTAELDGLIFSARRGSKSGGFVVDLDDRLVEVVREAIRLQTGEDAFDDVMEDDEEEVAVAPRTRRGRRARRGITAPPDSLLSPKEIQARLRAGRTVEEVASFAGVDEAWVLRFASPVLAEQAQVIERAQGVACRTPRKGVSSQPLGPSVAWNLADKGMRLAADEIADGWTAYHVRDGEWLLRFAYVSRGRELVAQWEFDIHTGELMALNRLASELGYIQSGRRRRLPPLTEFLPTSRPARAAAPPASSASTPEQAGPPAPAKKAVRPAKKAARPVKKARPVKRAASKATARRATKKSPPRKAAVKKSPPRKAPATKVGSRRASATKAVAKKAVAKKAVAKKAVAKKAVAKKQPSKKAPARKALVKKAPAKKAPVRKARAKSARKPAKATRKAAKAPKARPVAGRAFIEPVPAPSPRAVPPRVERAAERFLAVPVPPATFLPAVERAVPPRAPAASSNGREAATDLAAEAATDGPTEAGADAPAAARLPRQRPLVAVRRIDSRARTFGPPPAQRVVLPAPTVPVNAPDADEEDEGPRRQDDRDHDSGTVVIQAPRAGG